MPSPPIRWIRVRRAVGAPSEIDVNAATQRALADAGLLRGVAPGTSLLIAAGSRGIPSYVDVVRTTVAAARDAGLLPVVIAAMGSHGGATADGQRAVLAGLGITEGIVGAAIDTGMETVEVGRTPDGAPVFTAAAALRVGGILLLNRVKPHTAFGGPLGSGLLKMLAVGLGKEAGARAVHTQGLGVGLGAAVLAAARVVSARLPVVGGLALIENGSGELAQVVGVAVDALEAEEARLLGLARDLRPGLGFDDLDLLVLDQMGKEISGTGMDPWVVGRLLSHGEAEPTSPRIRRIYVRALSVRSGGNGHGVGLADFVHRRLADAIDWDATAANAIAAGAPHKARLPLVMASDRAALQAALAAARTPPRLVRVRDTGSLTEMRISEGLGNEADRHGWEPLGPPELLRFDDRDNWMD